MMAVQGYDFVATYSSRATVSPNLARLDLRTFRVCPVRGDVLSSGGTAHDVTLRPPHNHIRSGFLVSFGDALVRRGQLSA